MNRQLPTAAKSVKFAEKKELSFPFHHIKSTELTYRSKWFLQVNLLLVILVLLALQYQTESLDLQVIKMADYCDQAPLNAHESFLMRINGLGVKYVYKEMCDEVDLEPRVNMVSVKSILDSNGETLATRLLEMSESSKTHDNEIDYSIVYLCIDNEDMDVSTVDLMLNETFLTELIVDSFKSLLHDRVEIQSQISLLTHWNISSCGTRHMAEMNKKWAYVKITNLTGKIFGAIFFSIVADSVGRKPVYLVTVLASTLCSFLILTFHSYRHYLVLSTLISGFVQSAYVSSYVLMFELILNSRHQNVYCSLIVSTASLFNVLIGWMFREIKNWQFVQLSGSFVAIVAFGYPWLLKESFVWLTNKSRLDEAEKTCKHIFREKNALWRLLNRPENSGQKEIESNSNENSESMLGNFLWRATFHRIIFFLLFIWWLISLINHFIDDEQLQHSASLLLLPLGIDNYMAQNLILAFTNLALTLLFLRVGKRLTLGSCILLGGSFYLTSTLFHQSWIGNFRLIQLVFYLFAKILVNFSINILMIFTCELFPCEIRCSSFSFLFSIKHLSEMFAIYIFKINMYSTFAVKIILPVLCLLACIFSFLLPEHVDKVSLNFMNRDELLAKLREKHGEKPGSSLDPVFVINGHDELQLANRLVELINMKNFSRRGKLNPIYDEERIS